MSPYREASAERRERARAQLSELQRRIQSSSFRYGLGARAALGRTMAAILDLDVANAELDRLGEIERLLDEAEHLLQAWLEEAREESRVAATWAHLGAPRPEALLFAKRGETFRSGIEWRPAVAAELEPKIQEIVAALPRPFLVQSDAMGAVFFFTDESGLAFRLDVSTRETEDGESFVTESLLTGGRERVARVGIAVRPQSFTDDVLGALRIRRDLTFDDDAFDATYFVSGSEQVLREVLTAPVRSAFVRIAKEDPVTVELADGIVTMKLGLQSIRSACALVRAMLSA
ncbi:MAG: hypothetical protein JST00_06320 [Deltaproteobacteria bacterium]|nr:hypothetical protein [Deltaproteobacteria bacterium]